MASNIKFTDDQYRAYTHDGSDLIVAASAGAGKTAVLVEYIYDKISKERDTQKVSISEILAMTFTDAAANSMKKRLFQRMNEDSDDPHLQLQKELLPSADICTIDSFCTNLLNQYCYIIGWDPKRPKTVLDKNTVMQIKRQAAHEIVLENINNEQFYDMVCFYAKNGNDTNAFENLLLMVSDGIDKYADENRWYESVKDYYAKTEFKQLDEENKYLFYFNAAKRANIIIKCFKDYYQKIEKLDEYEEVRNKINILINQINNIYDKLNDKDETAFIDLESFDEIPTFRKLAADIKDEKGIYDSYRAKAKKSLDELQEYVIHYRNFAKQNKVMKKQIDIFLDVLKQYRILVDKRKELLNGIDFVDMEKAAIKILENKNIAERLRNKYKYILIDEYQDTNDIQETLVNLICRSNPGNVFRVGDIKQSIYSFRSAKPSLMKNILNNAKQQEKIVFKDNFRSSEIIIQFNNILYKTIMNISGYEDSFTDEIDSAKTLLDNKKDNKEKCEVDLLNFEKEDEKNDIKTDRIKQAHFVVQRIIQMKSESEKRKESLKNNMTLEELHDNGIFAQWKDYVVLVRNHDHKKILDNVFKAYGVPMFFVTNKGYYDDVAVQTVISWLKWLSNKNDEIAMFSILTSSYYEKTNNDLAKMIIEYKKQDSEISKADFVLKMFDDVKNDYQYLKDIYDQKGLIVLLQEIFNLHNFYYSYTTSEQRDNLSLFFEKCISVYDRYSNIQSLIEWIKVNQMADDGSATSISESSDVVRVITIHNSKGLEYPVVFYLASTLKRKGSEKGKYRLDESLGLALQVYKKPYHLNYKPLLWHNIDNKIYQQSIEEEIRLMYVATTRAKSKLVIVAFESDEKVDFDAASIETIAGKKEAIGNIVRDAIELNKQKMDKYCIVNHIQDVDELNKKTENKESRSFVLPSYQRILNSYKEIKPSDLEDKKPYYISYKDNMDHALRGTLIHKAYELIDFNNPDIDDIDLPLDQDDKQAIMRFFDHEIVKRMINMEIYHELPYALLQEGNYMHGYMDLVAIDENKIILIDFKSDKGKTRQEYLDAYAEQQKAYKEALLHLDKPITCYLYSLELDEFIEVE